MKYDEQVTLSWRETTGDSFQNATVWADISDEGTASFAADAGISRADAFVVRMRYFTMPPAMKTLLQSVVQRSALGDFSLASCEVRGIDRLITSITESDERRREIAITCTQAGVGGS